MARLEILGIVGSLRAGSYNRMALQAAQELMPDGATLSLAELHGIPVFNQENEHDPPAAVVEFKERVLAADGILFGTPEYNYSVPGVLKNAIDWGTRPPGSNVWQGKPAAIMGASIGNLGSARAQYHLRQILVALNMPVVIQPEVMIANAAQRFDPDGRLSDEPTRQRIASLLDTLLRLIRVTSKEYTS
ncbi:MAG: NAD(P)H-dependent oxidoreductase [Thiobacillus sp.]|nr:NAD(P)H-dependent oxidoreductase [Thiobacillus sp.]